MVKQIASLLKNLQQSYTHKMGKVDYKVGKNHKIRIKKINSSSYDLSFPTL